MDIVQHGVQSVLITDATVYTLTGNSLLVINPWFALLFFIIGIFPDLSGWLDGKIRGTYYRWNGAYKFFHEDLLRKPVYIIAIVSILFPGIMVHIAIDTFWHKPDGGWIENGVKYNKIGWLITIALSTIYYLLILS